MEEQLARYLADHMPGAHDLKVSHLLRVPGGASRETWMFKAAWQDSDGRQSRQLILRMDPSAALMDTSRRLEFDVLAALAESPVPVPRVLWLEEDPGVLGGVFILMERIQDADTGPAAFQEPRWDAARPLLGPRMYEVLADIHAVDWRPCVPALGAPALNEATCWQAELDRWDRVLDAHGSSPQPVARAAIRWLRRNPPPPAQRLVLVHGDYRVGNILFGVDGTVRGVLDWETVHPGDPTEDLAWSFLPAWEWTGDGTKGGIIAEEDAIAVYERASSVTIDQGALHWWSILCGVKLQAISLSAAALFASGKATGAILPFMAMTMMDPCDQFLLRALGKGR